MEAEGKTRRSKFHPALWVFVVAAVVPAGAATARGTALRQRPDASNGLALTQTDMRIETVLVDQPPQHQAGASQELDWSSEATRQAVEVATEIAKKPMEVLLLGVPLLAAKVQIASEAVSQVMTDSVQKLEEGDVPGAFKAATVAFTQAQEASAMLDEGTSVAASRSVGILLVFSLIGLAWGVELALTRRYDQREYDPESKPSYSCPPFFHALSFARYLFSWLVVADNFYNPGRQMSAEAGVFTILARWGCLAYPWFFLVSGFSNSLSKLVGPKPAEQEDWFHGMVRRVMTWYPFFVLSLMWCAVHSWSITAEDWSHFLANVLLINGLIWAEPSFPYVIVDQWLCFLMIYMLAWAPMYQVFHASTNSVIWTLFTISSLVVIPSAIMEWYFFADMPIWVLIQYWPSFCFGQALATWFVRNCMQQKQKPGQTELVWVMRPVHEIPLPVRFGPTFSFLILGISAFCFSPYDRLPLLKKPVATILLKGGLLPLMGVMVAGLACEVDPIAKLFARAPFRWAEKICLMNFILQVPVHNAIRDWTGWDGLTWTFVSSLLLASVLGHAFVEQPWRKILGAREK